MGSHDALAAYGGQDGRRSLRDRSCEAAVFVQAVGNLASATKTLIEQERKAHGLDDQAQQQSGYEDLLAAVLAA